MNDNKSFETKFCELLMDYKEALSTVRLIKDAAGNEYDDVKLKDINRSMNLLAMKMENINENLNEIYEFVQQLI